MQKDIVENKSKVFESQNWYFPTNWAVDKLGKFLIDIRNGTTKKQNKSQKGIPVTRIETISKGTINPRKVGYIENLSEKEIEKFRLYSGDILFSHINSEPYLGNSAIYKENPPTLIHGMNLLRLRTKEEYLYYKFLSYLFNFYRIKKIFIGIASRAVNQSSINQGKLKSLLIAIPPLYEQKKIAGVLRAVQEAKEKTEEVIKAEKELKKSLMKHFFTYGPVSIEEAEKVKLKGTEIGKIPEEWHESIIAEVVEKTKQRDPKKTPISHFKYIDVSSIEREYLKIAEYKTYLGKDAPSRAKKIVEKDDVIFATVRPTLKRLSIIKEDFSGEICSTAFCVLRAKKGIIKPRYLFYAIQRDIFVEKLGKIQRGASYPAVTDSDIKGQIIPVPSLYAQKRISDILSAIDKKIESEENKKKALEELFKTLLDNLMTGKIRVHNLDIDV